jgi:hypothetical protein
MNNYWKRGSWNAICDSCSFKYKSSVLKKRWDGLMVCKDCWEQRHPMDFLKVPVEKLNIPWSRHEPEDQFVTINSYEDYVNWVNVFDEGVPNWESEEEV